MRLFFIVCLFFMIKYGNGVAIGEANMHFDGDSISIGILTLLQQNADHPVRIVGVLRGLPKNTVHVGFKIFSKIYTDIDYLGISCSY